MTILDSLTNLLKKSLEGDPPPPDILQNIGDRLNELTAISVDPSGDGIDRWLNKLRDIANDTLLHDTLIVRTAQMNFPRFAEALTFLGVIDYNWDGNKVASFSINWNQFNQLLTQPGENALTLLLNKVQNLPDLKALQVLVLMLISAPKELVALEYRKQGFLGLPLGQVPGFSSEELIQLINDLVHSPLSLPLPFVLPLTLDQFKTQAGQPLDGQLGSITLDAPSTDPINQLEGLGLKIHLTAIELVKPKSIDLGNGWKITFDSSVNGDYTYRLQFDAAQFDTTLPRPGDFGIFLAKQPADANALLIGDPNGTHFAIKSVQFGLSLRANGPLFGIGLKLEHIEFALKPDFLSFLSFGLDLPALLSFDSDVDISYIQGKGLTGQGSTGGLPALGVQFATPLDLKIGAGNIGLSVDQVVTRLDVTLKPGGGLYFKAKFSYGANAKFGPLNAVMDGAGVWIGRWTDGTGGLLPPQGIGLSLDAGPVSGGGALKFVSDKEFAGGLQLKILGIGAFAYGLYKSLPNGDPSFVALIGIRLPLPGIQLSFGFAVSGFGGLVGVNRRADTDKIRERLTSGGAGDVLFNDNPLQNAPRLLGDMQQFFPDQSGVFLIGPTLQINWLYILKLDVGVFIQIPGTVFIAGSARLVIGSEEFALVYLRMDFIGGIDTTKSLIFFDAGLVNSQVLGIFRITGGVALRIAYGDNGYFLFTVGGFHPSFNPGAMELPRVARVGTSVSLGPVWLKQEMYLAITSNTFQLGFKVEAGLDLDPISAHGWFAFDALIQFKPFHFVAQIDAGFDVEVEGVSLCNVHVEGRLSGPGPLALEARASVKLLFVRVSGHVSIELNSNPPEQIAPIDNLPEYLKEELIAPDNLRIDGEDRSVIFAPQAGDKQLFAPVGDLVWEQKRAPLKLAIEKVEGVELGGWHTLTVTSGLAGETQEEDWFGAGTYLKLPDSVALNTSRFEKQVSGLRIIASEFPATPPDTATIEIHLLKLPQRFKFTELIPSLVYANSDLTGMLRERFSGAAPGPGKTGVSVTQEEWFVHGADGQVKNTALNSVQAVAQARQVDGVALPALEKSVDLSGVF